MGTGPLGLAKPRCSGSECCAPAWRPLDRVPAHGYRAGQLFSLPLLESRTIGRTPALFGLGRYEPALS